MKHTISRLFLATLTVFATTGFLSGAAHAYTSPCEFFTCSEPDPHDPCTYWGGCPYETGPQERLKADAVSKTRIDRTEACAEYYGFQTYGGLSAEGHREFTCLLDKDSPSRPECQPDWLEKCPLTGS